MAVAEFMVVVSNKYYIEDQKSTDDIRKATLFIKREAVKIANKIRESGIEAHVQKSFIRVE